MVALYRRLKYIKVTLHKGYLRRSDNSMKSSTLQYAQLNFDSGISFWRSLSEFLFSMA